MRHVWLVALLTVFVWGCGKSDHPSPEVADKEAGSERRLNHFLRRNNLNS